MSASICFVTSVPISVSVIGTILISYLSNTFQKVYRYEAEGTGYCRAGDSYKG